MTTYLILRGILSYVYEIQFATHHDKASDLFCFDLDHGWMDELGFYVPSTVFQSFRDDGRVNMKGSVQ